MSERVQRQKSAPQEKKVEEKVEPKDQSNAELDQATEDLLDEIDALLEDQDVLTNFVQRGGE